MNPQEIKQRVEDLKQVVIEVKGKPDVMYKQGTKMIYTFLYKFNLANKIAVIVSICVSVIAIIAAIKSIILIRQCDKEERKHY